jgi:hypothetical protein
MSVPVKSKTAAELKEEDRIRIEKRQKEIKDEYEVAKEDMDKQKKEFYALGEEVNRTMSEESGIPLDRLSISADMKDSYVKTKNLMRLARIASERFEEAKERFYRAEDIYKHTRGGTTKAGRRKTKKRN